MINGKTEYALNETEVADVRSRNEGSNGQNEQFLNPHIMSRNHRYLSILGKTWYSGRIRF